MKKKKAQAKRKVYIANRKVTPPNSNEGKIAALMALQANEGWAIVLQVLKENKEYLERMLIKGVDGITGEKLTELEVNEARFKLELTEEFINTPENYIKQLGMETEDVVDFDPYFRQ